LNKISPIWEIPRRYSISKKSLFSSKNNIIISRENEKQRGNKVTEQRNRKCKEPHHVSSTRSENEENKSMKTDIPIQETAVESERNAMSAGINYVRTANEGD